MKGKVERGKRIIEDEKIRVENKRERNGNKMEMKKGKNMRVEVEVLEIKEEIKKNMNGFGEEIV